MKAQNPLVEHDFGWWVIPGHLTAFRLSWRASDRRLRLVSAGKDAMAIRLGQYDIEEARERLAKWEKCPYVEGRAMHDARWLADRFPALRTFIGEAAFL